MRPVLAGPRSQNVRPTPWRAGDDRPFTPFRSRMRGDTIGCAARPRDSQWSSATQLAAALVAIVRGSDLFVVDLEIPLTGLLDEVRALRSLSLCAKRRREVSTAPDTCGSSVALATAVRLRRLLTRGRRSGDLTAEVIVMQRHGDAQRPPRSRSTDPLLRGCSRLLGRVPTAFLRPPRRGIGMAVRCVARRTSR
jgi:hypothetical protein